MQCGGPAENHALLTYLVLSGCLVQGGDSRSKSYKTLATLVESNHATGPHDARYTPTMPSEPAITVSVEGMKFQQLGSKPSHRVWTYLIWEKNAKEALGVWVKSRRHV